jgi:hypothetical protein
VFAANGNATTPLGFADGFSAAMIAAAALAFAGAASGLLATGRRPEPMPVLARSAGLTQEEPVAS